MKPNSGTLWAQCTLSFLSTNEGENHTIVKAVEIKINFLKYWWLLSCYEEVKNFATKYMSHIWPSKTDLPLVTSTLTQLKPLGHYSKKQLIPCSSQCKYDFSLNIIIIR